MTILQAQQLYDIAMNEFHAARKHKNHSIKEHQEA
jgi:hypothetical protein